jgi:hypothetical protein
LRHYATSRKVAGSVPDEVIAFLLGLFFDTEDTDSGFLRNVGKLPPEYATSRLSREPILVSILRQIN